MLGIAVWNTKCGKDNYYMDDYLIKLYHYNSMHSKETLSINVPNEQAHINKKKVEYINAIALGDTHDVNYRIEGNVTDAFIHRRTSWSFENEIDKEQLFKILINSFGGIEDWNGDRPFRKRTYPSGGALYAIRPYILINNVNGLESNTLYYFDGDTNQLQLINNNIDASKMYRYTSMTYSHIKSYDQASVYVFFTANLTETIPKYGLLSYRLALLETGHMSENLMLCCSALSLASVPFGGIFEAKLNEYLMIGDDTVLYFYAIG